MADRPQKLGTIYLKFLIIIPTLIYTFYKEELAYWKFYFDWNSYFPKINFHFY